ncbi:MAG TPA: PAS domain S-box protein, partial [Gemmatimonadales bacterium]|nr:PAS domain S-box protein [Gemmatimonadales bacterium]
MRDIALGERHHLPHGSGLGVSFATERLYRTIGDLAPGFLWLVDGNGQVVYVNRTWEEFTGSNLAELNRNGWAAYNHPAEAAQAEALWKEATEQQTPFEMELRYRRCDGEYRWMMARVVPLRQLGGDLEGWVGTAVDTHELKATQEALSRSEAELEDFFENAAIPIHWVGPDGTILRVNQAELDLLGYRREEYVGRNIVEFHVDRSAIDDILKRLTAGEVLHDYPARLRCRDGSIREVLIDSSVYFENSEFQHTRCFTRDVTAQRASEEATQRLAAIVASSADAIVGKTLEGVVTSWNAAAERMFGYTSEEMVGSSIFRLIPEELHASEHELLQQVRRGEPAGLTEVERIRKDGQRLYISLTVSPVRNARGQVVGVASIKRDVTERRYAQEALAQSQERLQLALSAARMATWRWNPETNHLSWDEGLKQL